MKKKQIIRLTEGDLHRIVKESVNKVLRESILDEIDLQVDVLNQDTFWLRDKNTWIEFTAKVWVYDTHLVGEVYSDDATGKQLCNSKKFVDECLYAVIDSGLEKYIGGFDEFEEEMFEQGYDHMDAVYELRDNIGRF